MLEFFKSIFGDATFWGLVFILVAKAFEVSIGTLRSLLVNKGFTVIGAVIAFFEIILWVFIASQVIKGIDTAPIKGIIYSLGYALGVYVGSKVEKMLAFGKVLIQINTSQELADKVAEVLRDNNLGVTVIDAKGKDSTREILLVYTNRKMKDKILKLILDVDSDAMITTNEVSDLQGGHVPSWKRLSK